MILFFIYFVFDVVFSVYLRNFRVCFMFVLVMVKVTFAQIVKTLFHKVGLIIITKGLN